MAVNAFTRNILLSALAIFVLQGCNENNDNGQTTAATQTINLTITKGPVSGASCTLFEASGKKLAGPVLSSGGVVGFKNVSASGVMYAECSGGSYVDEATGVTKTLATTDKMRGVLTPGTHQLIVSPLTEIAFRRSKAVGGSGALSDFGAKLAQVSGALGLKDTAVNGVKPADINSQTLANDAAGQYGALLACLSQYQKDNAVPGLGEALDLFDHAISTTDGALDITVKRKLGQACEALPGNAVVNGRVPAEVANALAGHLLGAALTAPALADLFFSDDLGGSPMPGLLPTGGYAVTYPLQPSDITNPAYNPTEICFKAGGVSVPSCYDPDNSYWLIDAGVHDPDGRAISYEMTITSELPESEIVSLRENLRLDTQTGKITQLCRGSGSNNSDLPPCYDSSPNGGFSGSFDLFTITITAKTADSLRSLSRSFTMRIRNDG